MLQMFLESCHSDQISVSRKFRLTASDPVKARKIEQNLVIKNFLTTAEKGVSE